MPNGNDLRKIQTQGVHHITIIGADRQTSIDFWEGVLGMPFVFDQPNLDNPNEGHIYFDPGDGRLITIFTNEDRKADPTAVPEDTGSLHHLALNGSMRAASSTLGQSIAGSWIQFTFAILSDSASNSLPTDLNHRKAAAMPT